MNNTTKCSMLFASFYFLIYPTIIMFSSYMILSGFNSSQVALMLSVLGVVSIITKPLFATLIDNGYCRKTSICLCILMALGVTVFFYTKEKTIFHAVIYVVLVSALSSGLMELIDSWTTKLALEDTSIDYAQCRSIGSLSFAFVSISYGYLLTRFGLAIAPIVTYILLLFVAISALQLPDPAKPTIKENKNLINDIKTVLSNKKFIIFAIFFAIGCSLIDLTDNYIGVLILEKGGTTTHTGIYDFAKAIIEFAVMFGCTKLINKYGAKAIMVVGFIGFYIKSVSAAIMPSALLVIFTCVTQAISFPFIMPAKIKMMQDLVPADNLALAMSVVAILTSIMVSFVCSPLMQLLIPMIGTSLATVVVSVVGLVAAFGIYKWC